MLPTYRGPDEESGRLQGPLLAARRARAAGGSSQPAVGLILLTAACCAMLLFQVWVGVVRQGSSAAAGGSMDSMTAMQRRALAVARAAGRRGSGGRDGTLAAREFPAPHLRNLVLVACHSVYTGLDFHTSDDKSSWYLLDYQQEVPGQTNSFVEHIQLGVKEAAADPDALLLFSGGKTRRDAGPRAEGEGYWLVAEAAKWYGHPEVRGRAFTEDRARDSLENLLFGLCRFYELTGRYPDFVVVVGYDFKARRFSDLHRAALRLPQEAFRYEGTPALNEAALRGEEATARLFESDPYGCGAELRSKRMQRDPFAAGSYNGDRCPEIAELLTYCGPDVYPGGLPWDGTA